MGRTVGSPLTVKQPHLDPIRPFPLAVALALAPALLLGTAADARAQGAGRPPLTLKLGALRPSDNDARRLTGSRHLGGEIDLGQSGQGSSALSVGYFEGRARGHSMRVIPITVSSTSDAPVPLLGFGRLYTGSGLGAYLVRIDSSGTKTRFGGFASLGLRFAEGFFVEAKYHYVNGDVNGISPSGVAFLVGWRL